MKTYKKNIIIVNICTNIYIYIYYNTPLPCSSTSLQLENFILMEISTRLLFLILLLLIFLHERKVSSEGDHGVLVLDYYKETCPLAEEIVRRIVKHAVLKDPRMAASLLRLHFHDCFVMVKCIRLLPSFSSLFVCINFS